MSFVADGDEEVFNYLRTFHPSEIEQIDLIKGWSSQMSVFSMRSKNTQLAKGVMIVFTRRGGEVRKRETLPFSHIKTFLPLGYQQPVEFYAPKYDTPEKRNTLSPDMRTTIHWQPVVKVDSLGTAAFEFYTADEPTSYTVIIKGLTHDGRIIRKEEKIWRKDE